MRRSSVASVSPPANENERSLEAPHVGLLKDASNISEGSINEPNDPYNPPLDHSRAEDLNSSRSSHERTLPLENEPVRLARRHSKGGIAVPMPQEESPLKTEELSGESPEAAPHKRGHQELEENRIPGRVDSEVSSGREEEQKNENN